MDDEINFFGDDRELTEKWWNENLKPINKGTILIIGTPYEKERKSTPQTQTKGEKMYNYEYEKKKLFTDDGQKLFIGVRDHVQGLLKEAGAFRMSEAMRLPEGVGASSSWEQMACIDRMIELGEIVEIPRKCWSQYKVYSTPEVSNQ